MRAALARGELLGVLSMALSSARLRHDRCTRHAARHSADGGVIDAVELPSRKR